MRITNLVIVGLISALVFTTACRKPPAKKGPGTGGAASAKAYDPKTDPLVNPPSMFEPMPSDAAQVSFDETLYIQLDGSPNTLCPIFVSSTYEFILSEALFVQLFSFDNEMTWKVNEDVVESFDESEDHKTFIVKMKPGLTWNDGKPFNAHDVVFSWKNILDDRVPCPAVKTGTDKVTECEALDDLTVKFVQAEPYGSRLWNLNFPVLPKHIFEVHKDSNPDLKTGEYYNAQARFPVSNGPYRIVEWKEQEQIVVERWDGYFGKKPPFKRIVFKIIPDDNASLLSFEKGDVDVIRALTPQQFAKETVTSESFAKVGNKGWSPQWSFSYIGWNADGSNPFFNDKRVRIAMTHALNIPLILDKVFYNLYTQCHGIYHPDSWMYNDEIELLDFDLSKAEALLDEAGWKVDPDTGWRQRDGTKFEFTLLIPQGSTTSPKVAAIFQEDLKKIGVQMNTQTIEWSAFLEKIRNHEFQAEIAGWGTGTDPDTGWNLWRSEEYNGGRNYGKYSNPRVDELFELGRKAFDQEERAKYYAEISKHIYDDQPYTFIGNAPSLPAFNKRIRGVQFSPRGVYNFDPSYMGWWIGGNSKELAAQR